MHRTWGSRADRGHTPPRIDRLGRETREGPVECGRDAFGDLVLHGEDVFEDVIAIRPQGRLPVRLHKMRRDTQLPASTGPRAYLLCA